MHILYRDFYKLARSMAEYDGVERVQFNGGTHDACDTAFLFYPPVKHVEHPWHGYAACRRYFWFHKRGQRNVLEGYFNLPPRATDCDPPYIVRPIRHFGGRGFYVAWDDGELRDAHASIDGRSYAVGLFRRTREFRAFFVGGEHTTTMLKSLDDYGYAEAENMPPLDDDELQCQPWNRDQMGTSYITINRNVNDKLRQTDFYDHADAFLTDYPFDVLAVDAAYNDHDNTYVIFETNFAPQCTIQTTLTPMMEAITSLPRFS